MSVLPILSLQMCNDAMSKLTKSLYATFARTNIQVEVRKLSLGLIKLLRKFNWTQVAILYENRTNYIKMKDAVVEDFKKNYIEVLLERPLLDDLCYSRLSKNFSCKNSYVKNITLYLQNVFSELKNKARSKYESRFVLATIIM